MKILKKYTLQNGGVLRLQETQINELMFITMLPITIFERNRLMMSKNIVNFKNYNLILMIFVLEPQFQIRKLIYRKQKVKIDIDVNEIDDAEEEYFVDVPQSFEESKSLLEKKKQKHAPLF